MSTHKLTSDGAAAVTPACKWIPVSSETPRGVSVWLINKASGVAQKGRYTSSETFFDHWFPLPTFEK
jgi:hypothetical protein